jgi:hypothetical protein
MGGSNLRFLGRSNVHRSGIVGECRVVSRSSIRADEAVSRRSSSTCRDAGSMARCAHILLRPFTRSRRSDRHDRAIAIHTSPCTCREWERPSRRSEELVDSADAGCYGDQMDRLWGEFAGARGSLVSLTGGRAIGRGGPSLRRRTRRVTLASRQLLRCLERASSFVGDKAGIWVDEGYICRRRRRGNRSRKRVVSTERILARSPSTLFLTHFVHRCTRARIARRWWRTCR